jgi:hypothetical protein
VPSLAKPFALVDPDRFESIVATMLRRRYSLGATVSNNLAELEIGRPVDNASALIAGVERQQHRGKSSSSCS